MQKKRAFYQESAYHQRAAEKRISSKGEYPQNIAKQCKFRQKTRIEKANFGKVSQVKISLNVNFIQESRLKMRISITGREKDACLAKVPREKKKKKKFYLKKNK